MLAIGTRAIVIKLFCLLYTLSVFFLALATLLFHLILSVLAFLLICVVTMQALRTAPPDMQLKDKFLVQTTVVPYGTSDEELVPAVVST